MPHRPAVSLFLPALLSLGTGACRAIPPDTGSVGGPLETASGWENLPAAGGDSAGPGDVGCGLAADPPEVYFLEGDAVRFTVGCTGALATDDADLAALSLPPGASFDPDTRAFAWDTGPADGGRIDLSFSVSPHDGSPTGVEPVTFWVADDPSRADNVPVEPSTYTEEWGLPVVHVATTGPLNKEAYTDATLTWYGHAYDAGIQIHGKTSSQYPKPSYALKLTDAALPIPAWGATRDHLLLVSTFDDNSYVRQKLTYDLWAAIAAYAGQPRFTPRAFFAVLYLDGAYTGLYLGVDRVDDEFLDQMGFDRDANLYKAVDVDANFALTDGDGLPKTTLHQGYEKKEGDPADDFSDLDALVAFTGNSTSAELVAGSADRFDLGEWMDAYLFLLYAYASDSYSKNMYLYHPRPEEVDATGAVFRYVPWDFNASWGQNWRTYRRDADVEDPDMAENRVFVALREDPGADAWVHARFDQLRQLGPLEAGWQTDALDAYYAAIDPSARRDWDAWGDAYRSYDVWAEGRVGDDDWTDYEGERAYVYQWVTDRAAYFDAAWP